MVLYHIPSFSTLINTFQHLSTPNNWALSSLCLYVFYVFLFLSFSRITLIYIFTLFFFATDWKNKFFIIFKFTRQSFFILFLLFPSTNPPMSYFVLNSHTIQIFAKSSPLHDVVFFFFFLLIIQDWWLRIRSWVRTSIKICLHGRRNSFVFFTRNVSGGKI